jgi:hypothetical protein
MTSICSSGPRFQQTTGEAPEKHGAPVVVLRGAELRPDNRTFGEQRFDLRHNEVARVVLHGKKAQQMIVAMVAVSGDHLTAQEGAVLEFPNSDLVLRWAEVTLKL